MDPVPPPPEPTLVLVPGLGLRQGAWRPTIEALKQLRPALNIRTVTLPGYGSPARSAEALDPIALARDLVDELPDGTPLVLCGHSSSCQVVAHAAVHAPHVVGLVLVGPTTDPRAQTWTRLARRWLATAPHEPIWQVPTLLRHYRRTGLRSIVHVMNAARHDPIEVTLPRVPCPVLLVRGPKDRIAPTDWLASLRRLGSTQWAHLDLSAGAHMVPLTHGPLVARAITDFLARVTPST
jgi:pimeloyl-ACP methyl ester carboxylesterase